MQGEQLKDGQHQLDREPGWRGHGNTAFRIGGPSHARRNARTVACGHAMGGIFASCHHEPGYMAGYVRLPHHCTIDSAAIVCGGS